MPAKLFIRDVDDAGRRGISQAAALAQEQLKYATAIACSAAPEGEKPDPRLVASLVQAIAVNYAAVK